MSQEKLKSIRLLYPGVWIVILIVAFFYGSKINTADDFIIFGASINLENIIPALFIIFFGVFYYALGIRNLIWGPLVRKIQTNIIRHLYSIAGIDNSKFFWNKQQAKLVSTVFYKIVDKDPSLTIKSLNVKHNGTILTCLIDTFIITSTYELFWLIYSLICNRPLSFLFWVFGTSTIL